MVKLKQMLIQISAFDSVPHRCGDLEKFSVSLASAESCVESVKSLIEDDLLRVRWSDRRKFGNDVRSASLPRAGELTKRQRMSFANRS